MSLIPTPSSKMTIQSKQIGQLKRKSRGTDECSVYKRIKSDQTPKCNANLARAKSMYNITESNKRLTSGGVTCARKPPVATKFVVPSTTIKPLANRTNISKTRELRNAKPNFEANRIIDSHSKKNSIENVSASSESKPKPAKRNAWDLKGRLEDMETRFNSTNSRLKTLEAANAQLQSNVDEKDTVVAQNSIEKANLFSENKVIQKQLEETKLMLEEAREAAVDTARKLGRQIEDLEFSKSSGDRKIRALEDELSVQQIEISGLKSSLADVTSASAGIMAQLLETKESLKSSIMAQNQLKALSSEQAARIDEMECKEREYESERRRLHNIVQELKGNIRVFCRVRPMIETDKKWVEGGASSTNIPIRFIDDKSLELIKGGGGPCIESNNVTTNNESMMKGKSANFGKYEFEFDKVFNSSATQSQIFFEICQLVQSAIDGYNVCVFAYGQTGSGKTFTMEGPQYGDVNDQGMIPRTIEHIFAEAERLSDKGWVYKLEASFLEIYNEEIRDLLAPTDPSSKSSLKYEIKMISNSKEVYVSNLKVEQVESVAHVSSLLRRARSVRAVGATLCNERSSRSHSVFILKIFGSNSITLESAVGTLNLVDLAGSERLKESGAEGIRLTETKNINKSLANLSNVIMSLAQKDAHVPYRNSKLTHLLQNSLGGNSKVLMFVNVSPGEEYFSETLNSLRFAKTVNNCQIGTATKKLK